MKQEPRSSKQAGTKGHKLPAAYQASGPSDTKFSGFLNYSYEHVPNALAQGREAGLPAKRPSEAKGWAVIWSRND